MMGFNDIAVERLGLHERVARTELRAQGAGVGDDLAHSSIRFSLGRFNTEEEVDFAVERVVSTVNKLREMSPLYEMAKEGIDLSTVEWAGTDRPPDRTVGFEARQYRSK
jgi:cysteine desulfurase